MTVQFDLMDKEAGWGGGGGGGGKRVSRHLEIVWKIMLHSLHNKHVSQLQSILRYMVTKHGYDIFKTKSDAFLKLSVEQW